MSGRVTVPILWDKTRETIVSSESTQIIRMPNSGFDAITGNSDDYWPATMRTDIKVVNRCIYDPGKQQRLPGRFRRRLGRPMMRPSPRSSVRSTGSRLGWPRVAT